MNRDRYGGGQNKNSPIISTSSKPRRNLCADKDFTDSPRRYAGRSWNFCSDPDCPTSGNTSPTDFATLGGSGTKLLSPTFSYCLRPYRQQPGPPAERATHLDASSVAAAGRTKRFLATFWEKRRFCMTLSIFGIVSTEKLGIVQPFVGAEGIRPEIDDHAAVGSGTRALAPGRHAVQ